MRSGSPPRAYPAPGWLTWALVIGLVAVFVGERVLDAAGVTRAVFSGGGALLVIGAVVWRLASWRGAPAEARATERLFFVMYAGCALALVFFGIAGGGHAWLGFDDAGTAARVRTGALVAGSIVLAVSLLSVLAAQWAVGSWRPEGRAPGAVDRIRITELAAAGLVVAMAGSTLMLAGYVSAQRDKTLDLSYFRTSSPGSAVRQITGSMGGTLQVTLFFPPTNPVKDEVVTYFRSLATGANVEVVEHDRLAVPDLADQLRVTRDGTIVLTAGDRSERIHLPVDIGDARPRLRKLDEEVRQTLMRVARDARTVYLTVGHGELNDPVARGPEEEATPFRTIRALQNLFQQLNYEVEDLGVHTGLGVDVPEDAAMVLVLGPQRPFLEPELESLRRYLDRGGSVLLALEPGSGFDLGPLRDRLRVEFHDVPLADDQQHLRQRGNETDRRLIVTDRFVSHAAVSTLSSAGMGAGILMMGAGYVEPTPDSRANIVLRSLPSTFADVNRNFEFQAGVDERKQYGLIAAIEERPEIHREAGGSGDGMRAMVFSDADLFSDAVVTSLGTNAALVADAITWLGREEDLAGETVSEEDIPIVHTRTQDVAWFYSTIIGAPALVLVLGLLGVRSRRRGAALRRVRQ